MRFSFRRAIFLWPMLSEFFSDSDAAAMMKSLASRTRSATSDSPEFLLFSTLRQFVLAFASPLGSGSFSAYLAALLLLKKSPCAGPRSDSLE